MTDSRIGETWFLRYGNQVLAEITIRGHGHAPNWLHGRFEDRGGFAEFAPLLKDDNDLFQTMASECTAENVAAWQDYRRQVIATMTLVAPHGSVAEYTMEVIGDYVTFSWSDEAMPNYLDDFPDD